MAVESPVRPAPAGATHPRATHPRARRKDDTGLAMLFIAPAAIGFLVFMLWPTLRGIYLSFTKFNLLTPPDWVGLDNYRRMVQDPVFWNALKVTVYYVVVNIAVQTVLALVIAVLMQRLTRRTWLRGIVLTPYLVSNVVAALVFLWILDYQLGIANHVISWLGLDRIAFLTDSAWVIPTIALINVWRHVGYTALLIFAGLQYYIYDMAFGRFQFGYASAMSVALLLVLVVITFVQYRLTRASSSDLA